MPWKVDAAPELAALTPARRAALVRVWSRSTRSRPVLALAAIGLGAGGFASAWLLGGVGWCLCKYLAIPDPLPGFWIALVWVCTPVVFWRLLVALECRRLREFLRRYCPDGRLPYCLDCDYDQRGTVGDTCPECGAPITLGGLPAHSGPRA